MTALDTLIIGAGIAGLTAARFLRNQQRNFLVIDKGRGVGGRVATRRLGDARADHGAPCFRLDDARVAALWSDALRSLPLHKAPQSLDEAAWICPEGTNALAKVLAQDLPLALNQTAKELRFENGLWHCRTVEGSVHAARNLLVTSPLPQSAQFFEGSDSGLRQRILSLAEQVVYQGQWTLMLSLSLTVARPKEFSAYQALKHPTIASLYHQGSKGRLHSENLWVVQATQEFSHQHLEADAQTVGELLSRDLQLLGWDMTGASIQAHRWRYARVASPLKKDFVKFEDVPGLYLAGDFCLGSTVMAAGASGLAAAAYLDQERT